MLSWMGALLTVPGVPLQHAGRPIAAAHLLIPLF
jgi:hypothetical protein